jgi:glucose-1-phosphatase
MQRAAYGRKVLLFDLGGVLVEWSGLAALSRMVPHVAFDEILARWHTSSSVGRFERGTMTSIEFAEAFVEEWQIRVDPDAFLDDFTTWVRGFYPGAEDLLRQLRRTHVVGCLSNTNPTHWQRLENVRAAFDVCIASHLTGHMKPDRIAFEHAVSVLAVAQQDVTYFDDTPANVAAARELGINAIHVHGLAETGFALRALGLPAVA